MYFNIALIVVCLGILGYICYDIYKIEPEDLIDEGKCLRDYEKNCTEWGCCMFLDEEEF